MNPGVFQKKKKILLHKKLIISKKLSEERVALIVKHQRLGWLRYSCAWKQLLTNFNFQSFTGPDGLYPVLLQKGWNQQKGYYHVIFQACLRHSYEPSAWKECTRIFLPKPGKASYFEAKSFRMITVTSFQLKWLERLVLYHINEDNSVLAKLSALQYAFRAGVSMETGLHDFMRRVER